MPSHPLADADARRDKNVPEPSDEQYASLFNESILLRMIPYDYRVYDDIFSRSVTAMRKSSNYFEFTTRYDMSSI